MSRRGGPGSARPRCALHLSSWQLGVVRSVEGRGVRVQMYISIWEGGGIQQTWAAGGEPVEWL